MGMGLSIARSIVHAHGGEISARNKSPRGATFHFAVPLAAVTPR
jgi:signal transduction histidine kinase